MSVGLSWQITKILLAWSWVADKTCDNPMTTLVFALTKKY